MRLLRQKSGSDQPSLGIAPCACSVLVPMPLDIFPFKVVVPVPLVEAIRSATHHAHPRRTRHPTNSSRSTIRYRSMPPSKKNFGPIPFRRHRRKVESETPTRFADSVSVRSTCLICAEVRSTESTLSAPRSAVLRAEKSVPHSAEIARARQSWR